jgi:hypothetical protein
MAETCVDTSRNNPSDAADPAQTRLVDEMLRDVKPLLAQKGIDALT